MQAKFYNIEGHPEGVYFLYGRTDQGLWKHLGEFELTTNKDEILITKHFSLTRIGMCPLMLLLWQ